MQKPDDDHSFLGLGNKKLPVEKDHDDGTSDHSSHVSESHVLMEDLDEESSYCGKIVSILRSMSENNVEKFEKLFVARYAIRPALGSDAKLLKTLSSSSNEFTDSNWMYLTQKHFNEQGGFQTNS